MATARRRGLDYEIKTEDRFSAALDQFVTKVDAAKSAWRSFRRSVANQGRLSVGGASKAAADNLKAVSKDAKDASRAVVPLARNLRRAADASATLAANMNRAAASVRRVVSATDQQARATQRAGIFQSNLNTRLARTLVILGRIVGIFAIFRGIQAVFGVIGAAIREAIGFSSSIEDSKLAIQSLVASVYDIVDASGQVTTGVDKFRLAFRFAEDQVRQLRIEGLRTAATFDQLLDTFQVAIAPGAQAGLPLDQIRQLSVSISRAAQAIGLPQNQLAEEIRSLLQGTISKRTTRIATALGIENEDIENAREMGTVFEFLQGQFEQFNTASSAALLNFSTRLSNLKDAVGQTLATGLAGSFQELKDLILDITEALIDVEDLRIAEPIVKLLEVFDDLGQEILGGLRGFVENLDIGRLAVIFKGVADSVRVISATLVTLGEVIAPIVETFAIIFSAVVETAQFLERWTGQLSLLTTILGGLFKLWVAAKAIQFAIYVLSGQMVKSLLTRLGLLKLISREWAKIATAATAATAAAGIGQGIAAGGAVAGLVGAASAALPALLAILGVLSVAALLFQDNIRSAIGEFVSGSRNAQGEVRELSEETEVAFLLMTDSVNRANEAIKTLDERLDDVQRKARQAELLEGFTGDARKAAAVIVGLDTEFEEDVGNLSDSAAQARTRINELLPTLEALGVAAPADQLYAAIQALNDFAEQKALVDKATAEYIDEVFRVGSFREDTEAMEGILENMRGVLELRKDTLKAFGIDAEVAAENYKAILDVTRELVPLTAQLPQVLATDAALRGKIVEEAQAKLRTLNAEFREAAAARRQALADEAVRNQALFEIELQRAELLGQAEGSSFLAKATDLKIEYQLQAAELERQLAQYLELQAANADISEINKTITLLLERQADLVDEFGQKALKELVPALNEAGDQMEKLNDATTDAIAEMEDGLALLGSDAIVADIDRIVLEQQRVFDLSLDKLQDLQAALLTIQPLVKGTSFEESFSRTLELVTAQLEGLPALVAKAQAGLIGAAVTQQLANTRKEVRGLLEDAAANLQEIQATVGQEGIARDLRLIAVRVEQQFANLRTELDTINGKVLTLATSAANSGQFAVAAIFGALSGAIQEQVNKLNSGELQVLKDEISAFALEVGAALDIENRNLGQQLRIQREVNRIESEGFAAREDAAVNSLRQQQARLELERQFADEQLDTQIRQLESARSLFAVLGAQAVLEELLGKLTAQRTLLFEEAEEAARKLQEQLERARQREEDPAGFFFDNLPTRAQVTADRTIEALGAIRDFLIDDLSGALVDSLFRDEDTLKERFQRLAEQLVQIMLKEFLQNKLFASFLTSGPGGDPGEGGAGPYSGGLMSKYASKARASLHHLWARARGFTVGGYVGGGGGLPGSIGGIPTGTYATTPPKGVDRRDTIPAWLTPKEFVMPVNSVAEYGLRVMEALRSRRIPAYVLQALVGGGSSFSSRPRQYGGSSLGFQRGGPVPAVAGGGGRGVTVVNATNQRDIYDAITSSEGQEVVLNVVRFGRDNGLV